MESFLRTIQNFGIGRLAAVLGASAGIAAVLIAVMMRLGGEPKSLLYSNLDLKEASQITSTLDQSGVKYEVKGAPVGPITYFSPLLLRRCCCWSMALRPSHHHFTGR